METTTKQMTGSEIIEALRSGQMTQAQVVELMKQRISEPRTISFDRAPKDGWKDEDRVR